MDRRKFISYKILNDFRERFIKRFVDMGITVHAIVGNHDTYFRNTNDVNSLYELLGGLAMKSIPTFIVMIVDAPLKSSMVWVFTSYLGLT